MARYNRYIPKSPGLNKSPKDVEQDPRKIRLMEMPFAVLPKPVEFFGQFAVDHVKNVEYYQDGLGCCVAESGSRYVGILSLKENGLIVKPSVQGLMAFIKSRIEHDTGYGATLESCPKALKQFGVPLETEYPSIYTLDWATFINDDNIMPAVEESGLRQRIKTYAWTDDNDFNSYKVGIYFGEGNVVHGGVVGSSAGWSTGYVRIPKGTEKLWGHSIDFIGYDENFLYFTNSWSWNWGLTLYLKRVVDIFGTYFIKGSQSNYDIIIKGVGAMAKDYEGVDSSNDPYLFRGMTYTDLPDDLAQKTMLLKTIKPVGDNRVYAVIDDFYYWITSDRMYIVGLNKIFAPYVEVETLDTTKVIGTFNKEY